MFYKQKEDELSMQGVTLKHPVCVFLTAYVTENFKKYAASFGVHHIYEKPILLEQL